MPWCANWGTTAGGFWWILPLIGLVFMGIMLFACFRGFGGGCMGRRRSGPGELPDLRRELDALKEDVRRLGRPQS
jgi:hypothetical protein